MSCPPRAVFLHPKPELAQCIFGCFVRDTRGSGLAFEQRFNHFAASPLCALSVTFEGTGRLITEHALFQTPTRSDILQPALFSGAQEHPITSWNDADVYAMVVAFYPDAMAALMGCDMADFTNKSLPLSSLTTSTLRDIFESTARCESAEVAFAQLQDQLAPLWQNVRPAQSGVGRMIGDWSRALLLNAALSSTGRSLRYMQRRVKAATGQPLRNLRRFSKSEQAFALALRDERAGAIDIAGIAAEAGYSDQSHMGRHVRAQTGFSPAELMRRLESDEAFWSYRLMGERY